MTANHNIQRESNFELLRIVSLSMIILHHIMVQCFYPQLTNNDILQFYGNLSFNYPYFYKKLLLPETFVPMGKTADCIFMIISGFFLVEKGHQVNIKKTSLKLVSQVLFATVVLVIASTFFYRTHRLDRAYSLLISFKSFNSGWWFVGYYYMIVLLGTLLLNQRMSQVSKQTYITLLFVLFTIASFSWSGGLLDSLASGLRMLIAGIFCYLWGGYCKKYNPLKNIRIITLLFVVCVLYALIWISYYNASRVSIDSYLRGNQSTYYIQVSGTNAYSDFGIVPISFSIIFFELFRRLKIKPNAYINYTSAAAFMVYLIHDNDWVRNFWRFKEDLTELLFQNPFYFLLKITGRTVLTYVLGVVVYSLYRLLATFFNKNRYIFFKHNN